MKEIMQTSFTPRRILHQTYNIATTTAATPIAAKLIAIFLPQQ
jgi:hypothetical protein